LLDLGHQYGQLMQPIVAWRSRWHPTHQPMLSSVTRATLLIEPTSPWQRSHVTPFSAWASWLKRTNCGSAYTLIHSIDLPASHARRSFAISGLLVRTYR